LSLTDFHVRFVFQFLENIPAMITTIAPTDVKNILEQEFFVSTWNKAFHFLPTELCDWALISNFQVSESNIKKWEAFEYGKIDFDETDFKDLIFNNEYSLDAEVLFISDESLIKEKAFSFKVSDYNNFVTFYENTFKLSFFQPEDYIVYIREYKELRIIHHDGKLLKIKNIVTG
jgi:hypothetical protein